MPNRNTPIKKRSQSAYNNKINKITKWYNDLQEARKDPKRDNLINPNTKQEPKREELKPLQFYLDKIKKSQGEK
jgi:hypothetical protein